MTVLVFGGNGQVGQELLRALAPLGRVVAITRSGKLAEDTGLPPLIAQTVDAATKRSKELANG